VEWRSPEGRVLKLLLGDITRVPADAIVNAANSALLGGGGVDGAIHRTGGPSIMRELEKIRAQIGRCPPGSAVVTAAGDLPAKYVFHAVGPIYRDGMEEEAFTLASCYRTCLDLAEQHDVRIISFPSISTGAYGYPMSPAAEIAVREVVAHLKREDVMLQEAIFVLFDQRAYDLYAAQVARHQ